MTDETMQDGTTEPSDSAPAEEAAAPAEETAPEAAAPAEEAVTETTAPAEEAAAEAPAEPEAAPAPVMTAPAADKEGGRRRRRGRGKSKGEPKPPKLNLVRLFEEKMLRNDIPVFRPGDTVKVSVKIREGEKERIQAFEGVCISRKHGGVRETFTVRKISAANVGVERTFYLHSRRLDKIELVRRGVVRRAKIYYLRKLRGKAARIRERRD